MTFLIKNKFLLLVFSIFILVTGCNSLPKIPKPDWSKPIEPNARKRAEQNVKEGKGIQLFKNNKNNGNFSFASSNPMWRATLDVLDFMSIASSDYSGGIIITDWYSEDNPDESIKINIRFLSNEVRADGIIINLYKRNCNNNVCLTKQIDNKLIFEIKDKILKKAAIYKEQSLEEFLKNQPKKVYRE
tara:strand:- start:7 stop:567 length:561 start_codon:yes stop_codon:yes gene_type:complete